MKRVLIVLRDEEHETLVKAKGNLTWEEYIMETITPKKQIKQELHGSENEPPDRFE